MKGVKLEINQVSELSAKLRKIGCIHIGAFFVIDDGFKHLVHCLLPIVRSNNYCIHS